MTNKYAYILSTDIPFVTDIRDWLKDLQSKHYRDSVIIADNIILIVTTDNHYDIINNLFDLREDGSVKFVVTKTDRSFYASLSAEQELAINFLFSKL